jgi:hypothetical protein
MTEPWVHDQAAQEGNRGLPRLLRHHPFGEAAHPHAVNHWRARCPETGTPGSAGGRTEKDLHPQAPRRAADPAYSFQAWELATRSGAALLWRAPTGLALPVVKVLADGTYLSVLINPKIRGARRRAAILAAATGIAEGTGADEDTDVSTDVIGLLVRNVSPAAT